MIINHGNNINKIKAFKSVSADIFRYFPAEEITARLKRDIMENICDELAPFMTFQTEEDQARDTLIVRGFVTLARVGKWEKDEDGIWHHCDVCGAEADEDAAGNELLRPYCSRCGAFLGGEYD